MTGEYGSLEEEALRDFEAILQRSLQFGPDATDRMRRRFLVQFDRVAKGIALRHRRPDIPTRMPTSYLLVRPSRYLIVFNPETRRILRIIDGRRDLPRLLS